MEKNSRLTLLDLNDIESTYQLRIVVDPLLQMT
jgi:hypothetical protein